MKTYDPKEFLTKRCPSCKEEWDPVGTENFGVECDHCDKQLDIKWFIETSDLGWPQEEKEKQPDLGPKAARHIQDVRLLCTWLGLMPDRSLEDCKAQILKRAGETESLRKELRELRESATNEALGEKLREWMSTLNPYKQLADEKSKLEAELSRLKETVAELKETVAELKEDLEEKFEFEDLY